MPYREPRCLGAPGLGPKALPHFLTAEVKETCEHLLVCSPSMASARCPPLLVAEWNSRMCLLCSGNRCWGLYGKHIISSVTAGAWLAKSVAFPLYSGSS